MHVLITGASRGIGKAIAEAFAAHGHSLYLTSKNTDRLKKTVQELAERYPNIAIISHAADLSRKEEAVSAGRWCLNHCTPDVIVNNAGYFVPGSIGEEPDGILESQLAVNVLSAYYLTKTLLPSMKQRRSGHIFNICSIASLHAYTDGGAYSISKFALYGFSKNLREELKPFHIKVTAVLPGAVLTDSWGNFDNSGHRIMVPEDVARMVYAASQLSPAACVEDIVMRPQLGDL
ncbi:MAG: SDR family oxidoreductase [Chitinophagaceae bacterium]|nr:SDR family oxidoreductase [Chitinophagaceae bacterium]